MTVSSENLNRSIKERAVCKMAMNCAEIYKVSADFQTGLMCDLHIKLQLIDWCCHYPLCLSIMVKCISMMLWKVCYIYLCVWPAKALYFHLNTSLKKAPLLDCDIRMFYKYCGSQSSFIAGYNLKKTGTQQESIKVKRNVISISSYLIIETATKSC